MAEQFHFDPDTYLAMVRSEVPDYELLQEMVGDATGEVPAGSILDLGTGTGETLRRVARRHPSARLIGIDESAPMLDVARAAVGQADLRVARLQDPLPAGPFDLVVSALAVHHLDAAEKAELFRRIAAVLAPGGRFVLADVILPDDPADAATPLDEGYDLPSRADEQLQWLRDAHLRATLVWAKGDLAVMVGDDTRE
jgi:tRNA (cmo5U34)-methyltransferase